MYTGFYRLWFYEKTFNPEYSPDSIRSIQATLGGIVLPPKMYTGTRNCPTIYVEPTIFSGESAVATSVRAETFAPYAKTIGLSAPSECTPFASLLQHRMNE